MKALTRTVAMAGLALGMGLPLHVSADSSLDSAKATGPTTVSKDDIEFLTKAAQTDMTEIQAAAIAANRGLTVQTKSFANLMTTDHSENSDDLHALAANKGVMLPTRLDSKHQNELDDLQKVDTKKFDAAYAEAMQKGHKDAVDLYQKVARKSKDPDIRAFAQNNLPTLQQHLGLAKHMSDKS